VNANVCLITYTTRYRTGGAELERVAETLARAKRGHGPEVRLHKVESKAEFVAAIDGIRGEGRHIEELHFIGHAGMYGPMFRTSAMPEQFSPHEWRTLSIPFAKEASAFFHACRTARWFAPFFARTFGVRAWGYHWYTTFSSATDRFRWALSGDGDLHLLGCPGKKSHGLLGSAAKYLGLVQAEEMKAFDPEIVGDEATYEQVAALYDAVFQDIRVRRDEWEWLSNQVLDAEGLRVLDIGCGNGALLDALSPRIASGVGVDRSPAMIALAKRRHSKSSNLAFERVTEPALPLPDQSVDVVVSLLSWRYLDWDPIMAEIRRVLAPGGRLLVVDMVTATPRFTDLPAIIRTSMKSLTTQWRNRPFRKALRSLVKDPRWTRMVQYNPIRSEHEFVWYFESRFPGRKVETLNVGRHARVLAFDSGPLPTGEVAPQSYP